MITPEERVALLARLDIERKAMIQPEQYAILARLEAIGPHIEKLENQMKVRTH